MAISTSKRKNNKFRNISCCQDVSLYGSGSGSSLNLCVSQQLDMLHSSGFPDGAHLVVPASASLGSLEESSGPEELYPFSRWDRSQFPCLLTGDLSRSVPPCWGGHCACSPQGPSSRWPPGVPSLPLTHLTLVLRGACWASGGRCHSSFKEQTKVPFPGKG